MPIYTVRIDGKTYDIQGGDLPPTEAQARAAISQMPSHASTPTPPEPPSFLGQLGRAAAQLVGVPSEMGTSTASVQGRPLITGTTNAQELRGVAGQLSPDAAQTVRQRQALGEDVGAGLGATALTGATSQLGNLAVKAAGTGLLYRGGKAMGVPPLVLDTALALSGAGALPTIRRIWQGESMPGTPAPTQMPSGPDALGGGSSLGRTNAELDALSRTRASAPVGRIVPGGSPSLESTINEALDALRKPSSQDSVELPPQRDLPPGYTPRSTAPRLVSASRLAPATTEDPQVPVAPQQTSSIRPTSNAFVNLDKGAPLPTDEARTFSTGVTDPGERARMSETHTVLNQENNAYRAMKNAAGPDAGAVLREALLKKGTTAADLTPTVGPALLQALLDSLKTGGR